MNTAFKIYEQFVPTIFCGELGELLNSFTPIQLERAISWGRYAAQYCGDYAARYPIIPILQKSKVCGAFPIIKLSHADHYSRGTLEFVYQNNLVDNLFLEHYGDAEFISMAKRHEESKASTSSTKKRPKKSTKPALSTETGESLRKSPTPVPESSVTTHDNVKNPPDSAVDQTNTTGQPEQGGPKMKKKAVQVRTMSREETAATISAVENNIFANALSKNLLFQIDGTTSHITDLFDNHTLEELNEEYQTLSAKVAAAMRVTNLLSGTSNLADPDDELRIKVLEAVVKFRIAKINAERYAKEDLAKNKRSAEIARRALDELEYKGYLNKSVAELLTMAGSAGAETSPVTDNKEQSDETET